MSAPDDLGYLLVPYGPVAGVLPEALGRLGWRGDARRLAESLPVLLQGRAFDAVDLLNVLSHLGFIAEKAGRFSLSRDIGLWVQKGKLPEVLHDAEAWRHAEKSPGERYVLRKRAAEDTVERHARLKSGAGWMRLLGFQMGPVFRQVAALSALSTLFALAVPLYVMLSYDKVIGTHATGTLPALTIGAMLLLLAEAACFGLRTWTTAWFSARIGQVVGEATFERLLALPALYTERATPAAQILRLKAFESARDFFGGPMLQAVLDAPFVLILICVLGILAGPLAFVPMGLAVCYALLLLSLKDRLRYTGHRHARAGSERQQLSAESFHRLESIRADGMARRWLDRFDTVSKRAARDACRHAFYSAAVEHGAHALLLVAVVVTLSLGIGRVWNQHMSVGELIASMILIWRILGPLHVLTALLPRYDQVRQAAEQIDQLMAIAPEQAGSEDSLVKHRETPSEITFSQVALRYGRAQDPVFAGLNAVIQPGELIAVTGSNGVGKSSILKLVQGLYAPVAGSVRLDGADLRQMDPISLRRRVAYLPQAPQFICGTLLENLRLGRAHLSEADAELALEMADARQEVRMMPDGLRTMLYPRISLPAGLAQRLHLARLYIGQERVLLIDELPNALVDSAAGQRFMAFLEQEKQNRTILFVTHREDHLRLADRILWLRADLAPAIGKLKPQSALPTQPIHLHGREILHA